MPMVSIIIRTKNEERWISHCLKAIGRQDFKDYEIILVDNESTDHTLAVARRFPLAQILTVSRYRPGHSLNEGIRASSGRFIACLSSHCIPKDAGWLDALLRNFSDARVAGVYGRQLPVAFTGDSDKRDLMTVFGLDRRVQIKDYFFHNANSMLRRDLWEKTPFDEDVTNIEDRVWGQAMVQEGYRLVYEPEAQVYHHHGLNQGNEARRVRGVVSIIEKIDADTLGLPESFQPGHYHVAAVAAIRGQVPVVAGVDLLDRLCTELADSRFVSSVHIFSETETQAGLTWGSGYIPRSPEFSSPDCSIEDILKHCLEALERKGIYPEAILCVDCLYPFRPAGLFDELVREAQYKGLETIFPAFTDYSNIWRHTQEDDYVQLGTGLMPRARKDPMYRALYGLGCLTAAPVIRTGRLVGGRVGILPVTMAMHALRCKGPGAETIVEALLKHGGPMFNEGPLIGNARGSDS